MGRGKIEIKKIENANSRQVTFSKRRAGLMKKAHELGVLCDAEVAVIIFSNTGKLFEHASAGTSMQQILARYTKFADASKSPTDEPMLEGPKEEDILKKEIVELEKQQSQLLGKDLIGLGLKELKDIEQKLNESLLSIKERKEQILIGQLELSRMQEQRALDENHVLRTKIAELKPLSTPVPVDHHPTEGEDLSANQCPDRGFDGAVEHEDTDLRLGFSSLAYKKREPTDASGPKITGAQKRKRRTRCTINDYQRK